VLEKENVKLKITKNKNLNQSKFNQTFSGGSMSNRSTIESQKVQKNQT